MHSAANKYLAIVVFFLSFTSSSNITSRGVAGDWPQILGPNRNGVAQNEKPIEPWLAAGPKTTWSFPVGSGYAGPAVVGERVIIFHRLGDIERVEAIDITKGKSLWNADYPATYSGGLNSDKGPRCVPLVFGEQVFVFGAAGNLHALKLENGEKLWSRDTQADYPGPGSYFGAGSSPIVADKKLLLNVGGRDAGIVAFDLQSGETLWKKTNERASYSSPTKTVIDGQQQAIFVTRTNTIGIDPRSGTELFRFEFGDRGPTVNAATPLVFNSRLFVSASYRIGGHLALLSKNAAKQIWANDSSMSSQYTTSVQKDGFLYGTHGREDQGVGELRCIQAETGELKWAARGFGVAHSILVGEHLLLLTHEGRLVLAAASPASYKALASTQVSTNSTRSIPAYSNGHFMFRDTTSSGGTLKCLALVP